MIFLPYYTAENNNERAHVENYTHFASEKQCDIISFYNKNMRKEVIRKLLRVRVVENVLVKLLVNKPNCCNKFNE